MVLLLAKSLDPTAVPVFPTPAPPLLGPTTPQPTVVSVGWLVLFATLTLLLLLFCLWLFWRVRVLTRAVHEIKSDADKPVHIPGPLGFLRFKLRTLLIVLTLVVIPLGLFMGELHRAQRQDNLVDQIESANSPDYDTSAHYRSGWLAESLLGPLLCEWAHPHFGYTADGLSFTQETDVFFYDSIPETSSLCPLKQFALIESFPELKVFCVKNAIVTHEDLDHLLNHLELQRLQLIECHLPPGTLKRLTSHKNLVHIELMGCNLTDDDLVGITPNSQITHLNLSHNALEGKSLAELTKLTKLQSLSLASNPLGDDSIAEFSALSDLAYLNVARTSVDSTEAIELATFPSLKQLNLTQCTQVRMSLENKNCIVLEEEEHSLNENNEYLDIITTDPQDSTQLWSFKDDRFGQFFRGGGAF